MLAARKDSLNRLGGKKGPGSKLPGSSHGLTPPDNEGSGAMPLEYQDKYMIATFKPTAAPSTQNAQLL